MRGGYRCLRKLMEKSEWRWRSNADSVRVHSGMYAQWPRLLHVADVVEKLIAKERFVMQSRELFVPHLLIR